MAQARDFEAAPRAGRRWIVVIGIDRYRAWGRLSNAVADATAAGDLFRRLGFEDAAAPLLDERATREAIHSLIADELRPRLGAEDSLVLFFAGHGTTRRWDAAGKEITTGYLIPFEASEDRVAGWIELEDWLRQVARLPARHILVILDSCHSGIALQRVAHRGGGLPARDPRAALAARRSRVVITSALDDERAFDTGPRPGHSMFTGCLIEALTGGISGLGGFTTGTDLGSWVRERVQQYLLSLPQVRQTPGLGTFEHHDQGEMLIPIERRRQPGQPSSDRWNAQGAVAQGAAAQGAAAQGAAAQGAAAGPRRRPARWRRLVEGALSAGAFGVGLAFGAGLRFLEPPRPGPVKEVSRSASAPDPDPGRPWAPSLSSVIEAMNPFVSAGDVRLQVHEVTRGEYARYLEARDPGPRSAAERSALVPRFGWARPGEAGAQRPGDAEAPLTSVSFRQAEAFCRAIGARLPTAEEWRRAAGGSWGLDPAGGGRRGPNREWTSTLSDGGKTARVCGAPWAVAQAADPALVADLATPYYKVLDATIAPGETTAGADPLTSPEIGFRCAR